MDFTGLQKMAASKLSSVVPDQDSSRKGPSLGDAMEQLGAFGGSRIGGMARQAGALKSAAIGSAGGGALAGMLSSAEMSLDATTGMAAAGAKVGIEDLQASAVGLTSGGGGGINVPGMSPRLVGLAAVGLAGAAATHLMMSSASPGGNRRSLSTASSPYAGDGSRRLSLQDVDGGDEDGNLVPLTPGGHPMSMDTLKRSTESKSIKIGRYRFTDPTNKKERSKPYIFVPSALLENPSFSFEEVFELLGLEVPAIIFRVNSAQDSRHWNVRLPPGRVEELHNLYDDAHNRPPRHKLHPRQTVNDDGGDADEEVRNNGMGGGDGTASPSSSSPLRRRASMSVKVSRAAVSPAPPSGPESTPGAVRSPPSGMPDIEAGFGTTAPLPAGRDRDASSGLKHYQGVLREKCRRLLKGTYAACMQAGAMFRANELWSMPPADELLLAAEAGDESSDDDDGNGNAVGDYERLRRLALKYDKDAVAEWLTDEGKDINVKLLGIADVTAFNTEITTMLLHNVTSGHDRPKGDDAPDDRDIKVPECILPADLVAQIKSGEVAMFKDQIVPGKMIGSFPHERLTHLIITDDQSIFDAKLQEIIPWGLMLINGSITESFMTNDCIQNGRPLIAVKYTGGTADLAVGMLEKRSFFLGARKIDGTRMPNDCEVAYSTVMPQQGHLEKDWLFEFDAKHTRIAREMNVLLENWPDRFNTSSVFAVDMFLTSEDEVQDRITQTMAVVFESAYELGGNVSEQKRLTYAWRVRQKFVFNAFLFKLESDLLMIFITLLTMLSTISAVLYTWFGMTSNAGNSLFNSDEQQILAEMILLRANLLLPLLATILRGIYASVSPMLKYVALKNAAVQLESEIYCYRTKVGKYGSRKRSNDGSSSGPDKGKRASGGNGGKGDGGDKGGGGDRGKGGSESKGGGRGEGNGGNNPRRAFSSALDSIWGELAGSGRFLLVVLFVSSPRLFSALTNPTLLHPFLTHTQTSRTARYALLWTPTALWTKSTHASAPTAKSKTRTSRCWPITSPSPTRKKAERRMRPRGKRQRWRSSWRRTEKGACKRRWTSSGPRRSRRRQRKSAPFEPLKG